MNPDSHSYLYTLNERFCRKAETVRWQLINGEFTNTNPYQGIEVGWMRSIKPIGNHPYLFAIDIDGKGINEKILKATYKLFDALKGITNKKPILKVSGKYGIHLYYLVWFPKNWTDEHIWQKMRELAYTAYLRSGIEEMGYLIGMLKKENLPQDCPGFIDMRIYRNGMIRGFSLHPGSRLYSVPFRYGENAKTIIRRMRLEETIPPVSLKAFYWNPRWVLEEYKETETFTHNDAPKDISYLRKMVDGNYKGDRLYQALPPIFKSIVRNTDDISHDLKVALVSHISYYFPDMSAKEITMWIWKRCKWEDLNNWEKTLYQVSYTQSWIREHKPISNLFGFMTEERIPLKRIFYNE
jgi:hypothetical protein